MWREVERGGKRWREYQYLEDFPYSGLGRWGRGHWPLEMQIQNHNDLPYTSHLTPHQLAGTQVETERVI